MTNTGKAPYGKGPIAWMAGNSVAANLIMVICLVGGFLFLLNIKKEVFPEFTIDAARVSVSYPGASPEEVEQSVLLAIEEAVQGLDGVDEVRSTASEERGTVTVEALKGTDLQKLVDDVQSEIDSITTFPDEIETPEVRSISQQREVLDLLLYGDVGKKALHALGERVRDQLLQDDNITQLELSGLPELEIRIEITQDTLRRYGLTIGDLAGRIRERSVDLPGGAIETSQSEVLVRMKERRDYGQEFARLPIMTTAGGSEVLLGQIASVEDGFEDTDRYTLYDGKPAVELEVFRVGDQTPIQVGEAVKQMMPAIRANLPPGVEIAVFHDMSEIYGQRSELMLKNGAIGLALVLALLGIFLEAQLAFWVMMGIPISFMGSFLLLPLMGVSINMISMFAYIVSLGIVVDDAIVVGENVYSYRQKGLPLLESAVRGAREVAMPVTFSILTNIAAFLPLYFIPGTMGKIFQVIPVVVVAVFLVSLFECLFVLPAHLGHHKERRRGKLSAWIHHHQQAFSDAFIRWVHKWYGSFLDLVLRYRYLAFISAFSLLFLVLAYALSGRMGMSLFPQTESDYARAEVVFPYGTPAKKTEKAADRLVAAAREVVKQCGHPELMEGILVDIGRGGSHNGNVRVALADPEIRDRIMGTEEFTRRWRKNVGEIIGAEYVKYRSVGGGPGHGDVINVELRHSDMDVLKQVSSRVAKQLLHFPIVKDVNDGFQPGKPQFDLQMKPEGKALGLTAEEVGRQIRNAFYGARALRQLRNRNEVDIRVRLPKEERDSEYYLEEFMVHTRSGKFVPLREVATATRDRAYIAIERRDGRRVIQVTADATPRSKAGEVLTELAQTAMPDLMSQYPGLSYSFEGREAEIRESMSSLELTFVLAMLGIYSMLAIPFRSYSQPLIIMMSIPFGIVGAVIGHLIMGYSMSVISMFGIVALAGVVVNDSLVLITFANRTRQGNGVGPRKAIHQAAIQRFRPIVLTSLTTFGGLAPLIFETSRQARMMIPMAISLGFGILFALVITLAIVPILYLTVEDIKGLISRLRPEISTHAYDTGQYTGIPSSSG